MDSFVECGDKKAQCSSREEPGIHPPPVLLVILFWHHVIFFIVTMWCAIGIVASADYRTTLAHILVVVAVQSVCAFPGLVGSMQKNMKLIYYFAAAQCLLAAVEFFWAIACFFAPSIHMLFVLLLFCFYQAFLCVCALRCATKKCEWRTLAYIWPFEMGTHPNYLPSYADKLNDQPSLSLYGTLSETRATMDMIGMRDMFRATPPPTFSSRAGGSPLVVHAGDGHLSSQNTSPAVVKSMHPASSELSTTSSTKSHPVGVNGGRNGAVLKTPPQRSSPPVNNISNKNNNGKTVKDGDDKQVVTLRPVVKTAVEKPSNVTAVVDTKTSSTTTVAMKRTSNTKKSMSGIMSQIFGPNTTLNTQSLSSGVRKSSPPSRPSN